MEQEPGRRVSAATYTYITIRTWDKRRVIVPFSQLLSSTIENWSITDSSMTQKVHMLVDFRVDVQAVRRRFEQLCQEHAEQDDDPSPSLQVIGWRDDCIELRGLCSAKNSSLAWELHCEVREGMLEYIQGLEGGAYLPRTRLEMEDARRTPERVERNPSFRDAERRSHWNQEHSGSAANGP